MTKRTALTPPPLWGWDPALTVEVERVTPRGEALAVDAVYVNGTLVGHVVGRAERPGGRRWWDHTTGPAQPNLASGVRLTYPTADRRHALTALVDRSTR